MAFGVYLLSTEDLKEKELFEQSKKESDEIVGKIFLLLNGLSHRKARSILMKSVSNLSDTATLHTLPLSDKN